MAIPIDPRRYGKVIARLQQSSSEAVRFAVQAELNAEALDQQQEIYEGQLAAAKQQGEGSKASTGKPSRKAPGSRKPAKPPAPPKEPPA